MDVFPARRAQGKEPFKWDWLTISDMLEYSFHKSERLNEALRTKWIKRVSGFYRCSVDEKGYFANLEWEPNNLQYLECACNLYSVLLKVDVGVTFLTSDRRGMLFSEMAHELEQLLFAAQAVDSICGSYDSAAGCSGNGSGSCGGGGGGGGGSGNSSASSSSGGGGSAAAGGAALVGAGLIAPPFLRNVFRLSNISSSMSREFFALLGRIIHNTGSKHLLEGTEIFPQLLHLIEYPSLSYLCRVVITALSFTDGGVLSRHLIQVWTAHPNCTPSMRLYLHSLLRVLLRSGAGIEAFAWCVDAIANQVCSDEQRTSVILKTLMEVVRSKAYLRAIIAKRPRIWDDADPAAQEALGRFLCIAEGIEFLKQPRLDDAHLRSAQASAVLGIDSDDDDADTDAVDTPPSAPASAPAAAAAAAATRTISAANSSSEKASSASSAASSESSGMSRPEYKHGLHISSWLAQELDRWDRSKCTAYVSRVEQLMTQAFSTFAASRLNSSSSVVSEGVKVVAQRPSLQPIPIQSLEFMHEIHARNTGAAPSAGTSSVSASLSNSNNNSGCGHDPNSGLGLDLHGLMRIPWNVEVKLTAANQSAASSTGGEYLRLDSYFG